MRTLELAANHEPVRYHDLVMAGHPKAVPPNLPRKRGHPPSPGTTFAEPPLEANR
ncbi:hypothetical protein [Acidithiobacillus ferriphilus]|uniref:hypothetical protein n=1 Tax=Acidithiobacillus ferriphilus TaxID=1689834 RepID=UPI001C60FF8C|nr:hypothetical protein [Acidithiobacillus ferriphilus]MEB8536160.1 hypothetical protein [Acidithiobacillus ferriphilus]